eukprot:CAMPEP_0182914288 /NCGR_PEP_ID=MMETSP0034_2-20130328/38493_1 /TAXON_ID=156128 /ORGANISM="Nephroselmis pyriformis, Strain CCMP717" /LENGTH=137 /DNA_ID=CAMNT_0025051063 /DNA_START=2205 /DNA_END=2619 /DNA_ORIENTATION=+
MACCINISRNELIFKRILAVRGGRKRHILPDTGGHAVRVEIPPDGGANRAKCALCGQLDTAYHDPEDMGNGQQLRLCDIRSRGIKAAERATFTPSALRPTLSAPTPPTPCGYTKTLRHAPLRYTPWLLTPVASKHLN